MKREKILIALGDSWTEGVGCYGRVDTDLNIDESIKFIEDEKEKIKFEDENRELFHELGWPNRVGKKLGFDIVYNLGYKGSSNSSNVKAFYNFIDTFDFENKDVLVIWLMTEPARFSFYVNNTLKDYLPFFSIENKFAKEYINEIENIEDDPILEQIFYIKTLESLCNSKGFDLILTTWSRSINKLMNLYSSEKYLFKNPIYLRPPYIKNKESNTFKYHSFCYHPNEIGYEWIANKMISGIKDNHSKWYRVEESENIKWEWIPSRTFGKNKNII